VGSEMCIRDRDMYAGPLSYQDGTVFVPAGRTATDREQWVCPQLLSGMQGKSAAK
jgi:simple sugar transport system substrate-binding protein